MGNTENAKTAEISIFTLVLF